MDTKELLETLQACGWLDEVPPKERKRIEKALSREASETAMEGTYEDLAVFVFDTETIYGVGDSPGKDLDTYTKIVREFGRFSWGQFDPQEIQEVWDEDAGTVTVSFKAAGQAFETTVPMQSDWFQEGVYTLINTALEKTGVPQRFQLLPVVDQCLNLAFISDEVFERAKAAGAFPTMAQLIAEETGMDPEDLADLM